VGQEHELDFPGFTSFIDGLDPKEVALVRKQVALGLNAPPTSSCGRLFDALAALLDVCSVAQYEGQAAMELQALADPGAPGSYPYVMDRSPGCWVVDPAPTLGAAFADRLRGVAVSTIAMRFHRSIAMMIEEVCVGLAGESGVRQVALSGGVFQNTLLLGEAAARLRGAGLDVFFNQRVPTNDGGISFGQAVIAHAQMGALQCPS
jgi:hydrogenase maturation protein HypF